MRKEASAADGLDPALTEAKQSRQTGLNCTAGTGFCPQGVNETGRGHTSPGAWPTQRTSVRVQCPFTPNDFEAKQRNSRFFSVRNCVALNPGVFSTLAVSPAQQLAGLSQVGQTTSKSFLWVLKKLCSSWSPCSRRWMWIPLEMCPDLNAGMEMGVIACTLCLCSNSPLPAVSRFFLLELLWDYKFKGSIK